MVVSTRHGPEPPPAGTEFGSNAADLTAGRRGAPAHRGTHCRRKCPDRRWSASRPYLSPAGGTFMVVLSGGYISHGAVGSILACAAGLTAKRPSRSPAPEAFGSAGPIHAGDAARSMAARVGPRATPGCEPRQARKGAAAAIDACVRCGGHGLSPSRNEARKVKSNEVNVRAADSGMMTSRPVAVFCVRSSAVRLP